MGSVSVIQEIVDECYEKYKGLDDGAVATYIPELGKVEPDKFGIAVAAVDGTVCTAGDWDHEFTIQSVCKAFAYQMALERVGRDETRSASGWNPAATRSTRSSSTRAPCVRSTR